MSDPRSPASQNPREASSRAVGALCARQDARGAFEGEMVWNTMILSQVIIVHALTGRPLAAGMRAAAIDTFRASRTPEGGFGQHPESHGYVFYTTLAYVALRLCGVAAQEPLCADARRFLRGVPGGVLAIPTWGKAWLSLCGLYEWEGVNPFPPELFLLPPWAPLHPRGFYCHTRHIYEALAYLWGARFQGALGQAELGHGVLGPLTSALRAELYDQPYGSIDFARHRHRLADTDVYVRPSAALRRAYDLALRAQSLVPRALRKRALARTHEDIAAMLAQSRYLGLSPVSGLLGTLVLFAHDRGDPAVDECLRALDGWRFQDARGLRYAGARSDVWDTSFAMEALLAAPALSFAERAAIVRAHAYLCSTQLGEDDIGGSVPAGHARMRDRQSAAGGWCFGMSAHGWPVSDCTAEALFAILRAEADPRVGPTIEARLPDARCRAAVAFLLDRQNPDGGFCSYERRLGPAWLERFNPSEMFGACMVERSYVECTASVLCALSTLARVRPDLRTAATDRASARALHFLRGAQRLDGAWDGFWGIHLTYGTFHAVRALRAAGVPPTDVAMRRAAEFLLSIQREDGAFGEHFTGPLRGEYAAHPEGQPVMTAWAALTLQRLVEEVGPGVRTPTCQALSRALSWLRAAQRSDGGFPEGAVNGVFFGAAMLHYRLYSQYFPTWALNVGAGFEGVRGSVER